MRGRDKAGGGKADKKRRGKPVKVTQYGASKTARRGSSSSTPGQEKKVARLTRELNEALERQAATSEVLKVISSSPGDLQPVFQAVLANATHICGAKFGTLYLSKGDAFYATAFHNAPSAFVEARKNRPLHPDPESTLGRTARTKQVALILDTTKGEAYRRRDPFVVAGADLGGYRTIISVPMLKEDELIGVITIYRQEVRPFTDKQIELVQNFAAQAVIAIENARLFNELSESLQQQTATADVLKVISRSTFDLQPVLDTLVESAVRLCDGYDAVILLREGELLVFGAHHGPMPMDFVKWPLTRNWTAGRAVVDRKPVHVHDLTAAAEEFPDGSAMATRLGHRSILSVPLLRENEAIGSLTVRRNEVRPFTPKQIELVTTFADQAVIAIENARLFNELQKRTNDLSEALEQQTATSEVLKVISSSTEELQTVFQTMLENAVRICAARFGSLILLEGNSYRRVALYNAPAAFFEQQTREPIRPLAASPTLSRVARTGKVVQIADIRAEQPEEAIAKFGGARTVLCVPLLKDDRPVGVLSIYRQEVQPFTDKQIELLANFAAQAVIAIENTRLLSELRQRTDDLSETLEQQTATSEVLKVISSSPGELEPVFHALLENATRICNAKFGLLWLREGDAYRLGALYGAPPAFAEARWREPVVHPGPRTGLARIELTKQAVHVADLRTDPAYLDRDPLAVAAVEIAGMRTFLAVPMFKESELVGAIVIYGQEVRPFTDKQIELLANFAAQAVIAIENTRLLNELRESLQQQTATADVLKVISRSTFDLQTVLDTLVESATRLCEADHAWLFRREGDALHWVASFGHATDVHNRLKEFFKTREVLVDRGSVTGRAALEGKVIHVPDVLLDSEYAYGDAQKIGGYRAGLGVPLLRAGDVVGVIFINKVAPEPFTEKQIELVTTFADQAVIAIENTRLLSELRESLQQQTATADVLKVISRSTFDLQGVLDTLAQSAVNLCEADQAVIRRRVGDNYLVAATCGFTQQQREHLERYSPKPGRGSVFGRAIIEGRTVHIPDVAADPEWERTDQPRVSGIRAAVGVPLLREGVIVGILVVIRTEPRAFSQKQIELLEIFADQAVIAIENVRLFDEVQARTRDLSESLQQQTATADVLKVISRSAFDLRTVLQTLVESAARLCDAEKATITREKDGGFYRTEAYGFSREFMEYIKDIPIKAERGSASGRALLEGRVIHIPDVKADPEYTWLESQRLGDYRTILAVPMLREGVPIGVLILTRSDVRPFSDKQIDLVSTFADQAAIAIENVRLFESVEARTRELAASLDGLRTAQDRLVQTEKLASLGQLTAGIAHEIKNPLNFVNNFSVVSAELIDELQEALEDVNLNEKRRSEINELMDTLRGNLDKVVQHGKRADSIVKNMLLHSRQGSGEHRPVDINAVVEESLNLAYHGARAEKQGFNITLEQSLDPAAGEVDVFPQEITRVLLNLISNGFYAATKKAQADRNAFKPTLAASTRSLGDRVEIRIRDNGTGIPPEVKGKLFDPFFTTKPAGEGTGLGLSISHDIIVKQHAGSIEIDTQPGEFTEVKIILPRTAASIAKSGQQA